MAMWIVEGVRCLTSFLVFLGVLLRFWLKPVLRQEKQFAGMKFKCPRCCAGVVLRRKGGRSG